MRASSKKENPPTRAVARIRGRVPPYPAWVRRRFSLQQSTPLGRGAALEGRRQLANVRGRRKHTLDLRTGRIAHHGGGRYFLLGRIDLLDRLATGNRIGLTDDGALLHGREHFLLRAGARSEVVHDPDRKHDRDQGKGRLEHPPGELERLLRALIIGDELAEQLPEFQRRQDGKQRCEEEPHEQAADLPLRGRVEAEHRHDRRGRHRDGHDEEPNVPEPCRVALFLRRRDEVLDRETDLLGRGHDKPEDPEVRDPVKDLEKTRLDDRTLGQVVLLEHHGDAPNVVQATATDQKQGEEDEDQGPTHNPRRDLRVLHRPLCPLGRGLGAPARREEPEVLEAPHGVGRVARLHHSVRVRVLLLVVQEERRDLFVRRAEDVDVRIFRLRLLELRRVVTDEVRERLRVVDRRHRDGVHEHVRHALEPVVRVPERFVVRVEEQGQQEVPLVLVLDLLELSEHVRVRLLLLGLLLHALDPDVAGGELGAEADGAERPDLAVRGEHGDEITALNARRSVARGRWVDAVDLVHGVAITRPHPHLELRRLGRRIDHLRRLPLELLLEIFGLDVRRLDGVLDPLGEAADEVRDAPPQGGIDTRVLLDGRRQVARTKETRIRGDRRDDASDRPPDALAREERLDVQLGHQVLHLLFGEVPHPHRGELEEVHESRGIGDHGSLRVIVDC